MEVGEVERSAQSSSISWSGTRLNWNKSNYGFSMKGKKIFATRLFSSTNIHLLKCLPGCRSH